MSENLRDEIAEAILANFNPPDDKHASWWINPHLSADAVLAVVGPELDRLRAEVERLTDLKDNYLDEYERVFGEALDAEAERDVLRARLAKVEALVEQWDRERLPDTGDPGWNQGYDTRRETSVDMLRAALASVPEPSDSEPVRATGAIVTERQRCICSVICLDHCRACNYSGRDLEEGCIRLDVDDEGEPSDSEPAPDADREAGERFAERLDRVASTQGMLPKGFVLEWLRSGGAS